MGIRIFQSPTSMFCEKVRVVLGTKELPYEIVDIREDSRKSLIDFSHQRKVPVMDYNGQCVIDSTFISAFLEERHPQNSIYPTAASDRGLCLLLEDWGDEVLNLAVHAIRKAHQEKNAEAIGRAEKGMETHLASLDQFFTGKQFIFDRMTVADLAIFTQIHYLYHRTMYQVPARYQHLLAWMDLMRRTLKLASLSDLLP